MVVKPCDGADRRTVGQSVSQSAIEAVATADRLNTRSVCGQFFGSASLCLVRSDGRSICKMFKFWIIKSLCRSVGHAPVSWSFINRSLG